MLDPAAAPVFPLGSVLLPGQLLPLQVFEPRYRVLLFDLREDDPAEFVVTLIERGSEVGGGEVRTSVGCVARIVHTEDLPDGRSMLVCVGTERVRVLDWLDEDPYPRATVEYAPELPWPTGDAEAAELLERTEGLAREVVALAARLGGGEWPEDALAADPAERTWQLALLTPLATLDRQGLLAGDDPVQRCRDLAANLAEQHELLTARLAWEGGPQEGPETGPEDGPTAGPAGE